MFYKSLILLCISCVCFADLSVEKKDRLLNGFLEYYNNLPNQNYTCEEGSIQNAQQTDENHYKIVVNLKVADIHNHDSRKYMKCTATLSDAVESVTVLNNEHQCEDVLSNLEEIVSEVPSSSSTTEVPIAHIPVQLDNEVQTNAGVTSGEQFIAIPRERPSTRCIGCASYVDPQAPGVNDLATIGVRQLDRYEPNVRHSLKEVVVVERQVQVVNGVRFILTVLVDYNSCTPMVTESCETTKACKITILEKPWVRSADGSKYRSIMANNCTDEWRFGDDGEVIPQNSSNNKENNEIDVTLIPNPGPSDDTIKALHNSEVQAPQQQEKSLTNEELNKLEEQIIPHNRYVEVSTEKLAVSSSDNSLLEINNDHVVKVETGKHYSDNSIPVHQPEKHEAVPILTEDKKKAIDDMLNFFDFSGIGTKPNDKEEFPRMKRSYDYDLQVMLLAERFNNIKNNLENAKRLRKMAETLVNYLNEMDMQVKTRVLTDLINVEEEFENNQHFYYIQFRVEIPCDKLECGGNDKVTEICNGVIDNTDQKSIQVLNAFCHNEAKKKSSLANVNRIPLNDKVLQSLIKKVVKKIESESKTLSAMAINKIVDATTQRVSGTVTKISVVFDYTNCSKTVNYVLRKRENCTVLKHMGSNLCEVIIHERPWLNNNEITYSCTERPIDGTFSHKEKFKSINESIADPKVRDMIQEALQYLEVQSNRNNKQRIVEVKSVSTKLIAGFLTNIEFHVGYTECASDSKVDENFCNLLKNEPLRKCRAQIWDRTWIEEGRQVEVFCDEEESYSENEEVLKHRRKRSSYLVGGSKNVQDINNSKYRLLAEESLKQFLQLSGNSNNYSVIRIEDVNVQVESGTRTNIKFAITPTVCRHKEGEPFNSACEVKNFEDVVHCYATIWEQPWLKKTEVTQVDCDINNENKRKKRGVPGRITEDDPSNPHYKELAELSMQKYLQTSGNSQEYKMVEVKKVSTQVVSGRLVNIDFIISPTSQTSGDVISCHSKVWEQPWLKKTEVTQVDCLINNENKRKKRGVLGGITEDDPSNPHYKELAELSMQKYLQTSGNSQEYKMVEVKKVSTQVVSGRLVNIDFTISPTSQTSGDVISCHSKVWEQPWLKKTEVTQVDCLINNENKRKKRGVLGGITEDDPSNPHYKELAELSMQKYLQTSGNSQEYKMVEVKKVSTQVVSGRLVNIDFTISPTSQTSGDVISCHSKVWEQPWLKKTEVTQVDCLINNENKRKKRGAPGGITEDDPSNPHFKDLAELSMQKYLQTSGNSQEYKMVEVKKVSTQVVSGRLVNIDFTISPTSQTSGDVISCHSKVWEQPWLKKTEVTQVDCLINNENKRKKRGVLGGITEDDPSNPHYKELAELSMQKYLQTSGNSQEYKMVEVKKVSTQVVSGRLVNIDFTISPTSQTSGDVISCHSKVWEQPWLKKTEVTQVDCLINNENKRKKRGAPGGITEDDPSNPHFKDLAELSMQKYLQTSGNTQKYKMVEVKKVSTQVVSGRLVNIDFTISPTSQTSGDVISCHSKVWEQPWLKKTEVTEVDCHIYNAKNRKKRAIMQLNPRGGEQEQDANKDAYKLLAEESLLKYQRLQKLAVRHKVFEVKRVTTKVVAGTIYKINFSAKPTTCSVNVVKPLKCKMDNGSVILYCHTEIWDRPWLKSKRIEVSCNTDDDDDTADKQKRSVIVGAPTEMDVNNMQYKLLANEALRKYQKESKTEYVHKVVKIYGVTDQVVEGSLIKIAFSVSPTSCLIKEAKHINNCEIQIPKVVLFCNAKIWDRPWLNDKNIKVMCKKHNRKEIAYDEPDVNMVKSVRVKRQADVDDNDVDEDLKFYYADLAIKHLNDEIGTTHLNKLITVHDIQTGEYMKISMIRMYIETVLTFCLKRDEVLDLAECEELDDYNHRICLAKIWPSPDDELVVDNIEVICDDNEKFKSVTGLAINEFVAASMKELEKKSELKYKLVHIGEPQMIPNLDSKAPIRLNFIIGTTNCSKDIDLDAHRFECFVDTMILSKECFSLIWLTPSSKTVRRVFVDCAPTVKRDKRSVSIDPVNATADDLLIQKLVRESLIKLEMVSQHRYKQRLIQINSYSTKITSAKLTTIDFDVGYTSCLKYEWVNNEASCEFLVHLPRRHCVSHVRERLWVENGRFIEVDCEDDETALEPNIEFESVEMAMQLAKEALKHIEAKYPNPRKQKVIRIFSLEKQLVAGIHYRLKVEVGATHCVALSGETDCKLDQNWGMNKFCRVNVWLRPWTDHPPNYHVTCDYQEGFNNDLYHHMQAEYLFQHFIATYKPDYMNDHRKLMTKFETFKLNVRKIHELNCHERGTATYGVTRFTDLSPEEFRSKHLGLKLSLMDDNHVPMRKAEIPNTALPEKFDWRESGAVSEVKDQGSCGSCWAFSVTGNIEGQWKMLSGDLVSLSEQELIDCDKLDEGCNGGLPDNAYRAIEQLGGLELEDDYPYEGEDDKCTYNKTLSKVQISGAVNISSNETDMAKWLVNNGPISIGINANAMQFYMGGVSHPWKMLCNPKNLDHGVLIVGYGIKDYPLFNKRLPYWIIKNSWGKSWGEQGYYRVFRGDGTCGVNLMASSAVI